jgi:hypothetical protein
MPSEQTDQRDPRLLSLMKELRVAASELTDDDVLRRPMQRLADAVDLRLTRTRFELVR